MGSFIQLDSISIDLANSIDQTNAGKCDKINAGNGELFSIRGYVSEVRKKDWKICWPFPLQGNHSESEDQPLSLPPFDVPKFQRRCCQHCQQEIAAEGSEDGQKEFNCCSTGCRSASTSKAALGSDIEKLLTPSLDSLERREIDLNSSFNFSCANDCLQPNDEKEKKIEAANSRIIENEAGLEDNLNNQITGAPPPEDYPGIPEALMNNRGFKGNEVSDVELATSNLEYVAKYSSEIYNGRTHISADRQCHKELNKACELLGDRTVVSVADNTTHHPSIESATCQNDLPGITETMVENDIRDHHLEKASGLPRRRPRKVRLLTDLLSENVKTKTEKSTVLGPLSDCTTNASAALQILSTSHDRLDVQGDLTNMVNSRKGKFLPGEGQKRTEMSPRMVEIEVQNPRGDAEVIDTVKDTGSKYVHSTGLRDVAKSYCIKPEIEKSPTIGKKKNKKIHIVDNRLIPYPYQNEENMDVASKAYTAETLDASLSPAAFTKKNMDSFPLHSSRTEKECNLSKRKGKMLQVDGELASLSWKNDALVEDSFTLTGAEVISSIPVAVPFPSAPGLIDKGVEEGLHLSLSSYWAVHDCNKKLIHQIENKPPFPLSLQEGTSKVHQLTRKGRETSVVGETSIPYKHIIDPIAERGVHRELSSKKNPLAILFPNKKHKHTSQAEDGIHFHDQQMQITRTINIEKTADALEKAGIKKNKGNQTADKVSEEGIIDDIPMEIVELMAKNQHERRLSDSQNRNHQPEKSTIRRKAQMTVGIGVHGKGGFSLSAEGQKEKSTGRQGKNGMTMREENVRPGKRKSVHYFSPIDGDHLYMNSLGQPQSSFGFEVSHPQKKPPSGFHLFPMGSSQLTSSQNCKLNVSTLEHVSSDSTLLAHGGSSLNKTVLRQDDQASSSILASLTPKHVSMGYDIPKKVVPHSTSAIMDMTSRRSGTLHKQNMNRDIGRNHLNLNATGFENLNRNMGPGTFSRMNSEYAFPCKQDMRGSLDLYSNETIPAMHLLSLMDAGMESGKTFNASVGAQTLNRPSYRSDCSGKLEIGTSMALGSLKRPSSDYYKSYLSNKSHGSFLSSPTSGASSPIQHTEKFTRATNFNSQISSRSGKKEKIKSSNSAMQNKGNKQLSWPCLETETLVHRTSEAHGTCGTSMTVKNTCVSNTCSINRNPADFTMPEVWNAYMIRGEDLKFEKASIPKKRYSLFTLQGCKQQRDLKRTKLKEHVKD